MTKLRITATENRLGATSKKLLLEVGKKIGLEEIVVTSTIRSPRAQAEAMLTNLEQRRHIVYKWAGEEVNKLARAMRGKKAEREDILKAMVAKIEELAKFGSNGRVSKHCVAVDDYDKCNIIDLSYRSMGNKAEAFLNAILEYKEVVKVIQPVSRKIKGYDGAEPAIHLEINQI